VFLDYMEAGAAAFLAAGFRLVAAFFFVLFLAGLAAEDFFAAAFFLVDFLAAGFFFAAAFFFADFLGAAFFFVAAFFLGDAFAAFFLVVFFVVAIALWAPSVNAPKLVKVLPLGAQKEREELTEN